MITWDNPILITMALFLFFLGPIYTWGLLHFFRHNFQWHLASIIGICVVVSVTAIMVWRVRGIAWEQYVWDLALVFMSASPSMALVGYVLHRDKVLKDEYTQSLEHMIISLKEQLQIADNRLDAQEGERQRMLDEIKLLIEVNHRSELDLLHEALNLIGLRDEAKRLMERKN